MNFIYNARTTCKDFVGSPNCGGPIHMILTEHEKHITEKLTWCTGCEQKYLFNFKVTEKQLEGGRSICVDDVMLKPYSEWKVIEDGNRRL